jgi:hypothetical protein
LLLPLEARLATPSSKPLPVYPLGLAPLVLQRLSIWLSLVVVGAVISEVVEVVQVGLEQEQGFLLPQGRTIR